MNRDTPQTLSDHEWASPAAGAAWCLMDPLTKLMTCQRHFLPEIRRDNDYRV